MQNLHSFHIPVLGIGYSIDTPLKVAHFGISSVVSIMDDELIESFRKFYSEKAGIPYTPLKNNEDDARARRIQYYLDLIQLLLHKQFDDLSSEALRDGTEIMKYFSMLPPEHFAHRIMSRLKESSDPAVVHALETQLRLLLKPGSVEVNIMAKVDSNRSNSSCPLPQSDALSALRGFALSKLNGSLVISAGYNPRLFSYLEEFNDFFPDESQGLKKRVILKVSDYRSAYIQGNILARKGIWVSEFRIESGINCGGHAFPTDGVLIGPILDEFRCKRSSLREELFLKCNATLLQKGKHQFESIPDMKLTYQGGVGTASEHKYLLEKYGLDSIGWGSPFLLVPEVSNVDASTLSDLSSASPEDFFLSNASPLGLPFHNFRKSSSEKQRIGRIEKNRPGSPCYKKFLVSSKEFGQEAICTASREYQHAKINQLQEKNLSGQEYSEALQEITEKDCLCEGLSSSALIKEQLPLSHKLSAVTICPGPNLAYFSGVFSLSDMVSHIYGRKNILNKVARPNLFIKELQLYISYLAKQSGKMQSTALERFAENIRNGIHYYMNQVHELSAALNASSDKLRAELEQAFSSVGMMYGLPDSDHTSAIRQVSIL